MAEPHGDGGSDAPASLLSEVRRLRKDARSVRHAYWLPLVLFGLVIGASAPFYVLPPFGPGHPVIWTSVAGLPALAPLVGQNSTALTIYWLIAIGAGLYVTWLWYLRHGRRVGLMTPARGFVIAGVVVGLLCLVLPAFQLVPGDLVVRGTMPFVIVAAALWVLAWAERSTGLAVVAAVFTGAALLASLYNVENVLFWLGWWHPTTSDMRFSTLPNILLPALVLLASGAGAYLVQRRRQVAP
jgi:hypothetical protein